MPPQVLALIRINAPDGRSVATAVGAYSAALGLGAITGQLVGDLILALAPVWMSWRGVFLINLPFAVVALTIGVMTLPPRRFTSTARVDFFGAVLLTAAVSALLVSVVLVAQSGFDRNVLLLGGARRPDRRHIRIAARP